jgi:hypothetical protein
LGSAKLSRTEQNGEIRRMGGEETIIEGVEMKDLEWYVNPYVYCE